jgi:hypothetical protein
MIPGQNRGVLEANIVPILESLAPVRSEAKDIESRMAHYKILPGETRGYLNNPKTLYKADMRVLCLLTEAIYAKTSNVAVKPLDYFTHQEIQAAHQYDANVYRNEMKLPLTLGDFHLINMDYIGEIDIKTIKKLLDNQLLHYNFDVQREATIKHVRDEIIMMPTLNQKNINEIADLIEKKELVTTNIVFNAALGTGDDGNEVIYDDKKRTVTFMPGTKIDIVDGYHRCTAASQVLLKNPNADFKFGLLILNTDTIGAKRYQGQLAKQTPLSMVRRKALEEATSADKVVTLLKRESDLRGKISEGKYVIKNELVAYDDLVEYIDQEFKLQVNADILKVSKYLNEFFTYLVGEFPNELSLNVAEGKRTSYVGNQFMFAGYIYLAAQMYYDNIPAEKVETIISQMDFSKNEDWAKIIRISQKKAKITEIKKKFDQLETPVN